jgi:hypothetical protein
MLLNLAFSGESSLKTKKMKRLGNSNSWCRVQMLAQILKFWHMIHTRITLKEQFLYGITQKAVVEGL